MTITASGSGAAFLSPVLQQNGTWALVLTAVPTISSMSLALTEAQAGYSNSPHETDFTLTYQAPVTGAGPILASIVADPRRTIKISRTSTTPPKWNALFNPKDNAPYFIDLSDFLSSDEPLDTLTGWGVDAIADALGVDVDDGARRPVVDRTSKMIALWFKVATGFQEPSYFTTPVDATISVTFTTSASPAETYRRAGFLTIKQVL